MAPISCPVRVLGPPDPAHNAPLMENEGSFTHLVLRDETPTRGRGTSNVSSDLGSKAEISHSQSDHQSRGSCQYYGLSKL